MKLTAERYTRLSRAYVTLAEQFQQLDVEHMILKQKVVPLIRALKQYQHMGQQWRQEKASLTQQLQHLEVQQQQLQAALSVGANREQQLVDQLHVKDAENETLNATLAALQTAQTALEQSVSALADDKLSRASHFATLEAQQAELSPLTELLDGEAFTVLSEAEAQIALVEETLAEMETDPTPDLSPADQALLAACEADRLVLQGEPQPMASVTPLPVHHNGAALPHSA